jgi:hypothetical protein
MESHLQNKEKVVHVAFSTVSESLSFGEGELLFGFRGIETVFGSVESVCGA